MLGPTQIIFIFLIVLLLFGAKRIPEIAGSVAKGIKEFKKAGTEVDDKNEITSEKSNTDKKPEDSKV